jgi:hypothetical protein
VASELRRLPCAPNGIRTRAATLKASAKGVVGRRGNPVSAGKGPVRVLIIAGRWVLFGARMGPEWGLRWGSGGTGRRRPDQRLVTDRN